MLKPHPWLNPLYRRAITLAVCFAWLGFELWQRETLWLVMALAATGYALWDFFLSGNYPTEEASKEDNHPPPAR